MNKGFVFTIDSIFAIIVAVSLISALVSMQQTEKGKEKMFKTTSQKAMDKAMVDFYVSDDTAGTVPAAAKYYYSAKTIRYAIPTERDEDQGTIKIITKIEASQ